MKPVLIIIAFIGVFSVAKAQQSTDKDNKIYTAVEHEPEPPGGMSKFFEYLVKNIHAVGKNNEEAFGRFTIQIIIEKDGTVSHIKAQKDGRYSKLTKEVRRIIKTQPKWKPAMQNGYPVRCRFSLPIYIEPGMSE